MKKILISIIIIISFSNLFAQLISSGQINAIMILAEKQGFTQVQLNQYISQNYNGQIRELTKDEASQIIKIFQSANPPRPDQFPVNVIPKKELNEKPNIKQASPTTRNNEPKPFASPGSTEEPLTVATILEVGMEKRFHLLDNNIIQGKIIKIDEDICHIETNDGVLRIPKSDILDEKAEITKKDGTRFSGPVILENGEEILIRSKYGDVSINKRDIDVINKFHGGRKSPISEDTHKFFRGEAELINVLMDPTAFHLKPQTFYVSGMSVGYGFTEKFMLTTKFGSGISGDLNIHPKVRLYHHQTGTKERSISFGFGMHRNYPDKRLVAKYSHAIDSSGILLNETNKSLDEIMVDSDKKSIYSDFYLVFSNRRSLESGRGKVGYSIGIESNTLALNKPELASGWNWSEESEFKYPFRVWASFEYDLRKNLKFVGSVWVDNGNKTRTLEQVIDDYFTDTPFIFDSPKGTYSIIDFDFGFLYALNESFRIGFHFQDPYLDIYWEFFEF